MKTTKKTAALHRLLTQLDREPPPLPALRLSISAARMAEIEALQRTYVAEARATCAVLRAELARRRAATGAD